MHILRIGQDVYCVYSGSIGLILSASEMLDLYDWMLLNYRVMDSDRSTDGESDNCSEDSGIDTDDRAS